MSDTPSRAWRTCFDCGDALVVDASDYAILERALAEVRESLQQQYDTLTVRAMNAEGALRVERLEREHERTKRVDGERFLDTANAEVERLRGLLREMREVMRGHMIDLNCHGPSMTADQIARLDAALATHEEDAP